MTHTVVVLEVFNSARDFPVFVERSSRFNLSYINSIYLQPATEEFEAGQGDEIVLKGVRTESAGVAQYYGFEEGRSVYPVTRRMKSFALRIGMSSPQTVEIGNRKISVGEWGKTGTGWSSGWCVSAWPGTGICAS
ncbi:MAG TPA: hypothetical protein VLS90_07375 [Thermodesulfobacteriota bacterium]|nr:hypothetical protein [Thermodesulfobacteriota bacterium]